MSVSGVPKDMVFVAALVINRVSILVVLVSYLVWVLHSRFEVGMTLGLKKLLFHRYR